MINSAHCAAGQARGRRNALRLWRTTALHAGSTRRGFLMSRAKLLLLQVMVALTAVALWHVLSTDEYLGVAVLPPFFFSTPGDVAARVARLFAGGAVWRHLWVTLAESMLAFAIGATAGVLIGFWFARKPAIAAVFDPYLKMINTLPRVVLAPIFTLWFHLALSSNVPLASTLLSFTHSLHSYH